VLYFSEGKPSAQNISQETDKDVILRLDKKTKKIKGFTILNFRKRLKSKSQPIELPIIAKLIPA
jgi:hypothetical protein